MTGCAAGSARAPVSPSNAAPPPPTSHGSVAAHEPAETVDETGGDVAVAERYANAICACHTAACDDRVEAAYAHWKWKTPHEQPSSAMVTPMMRANDCHGDIMSRGTHVAYFARVAELDTPACDDYVKAIEALTACTSVSMTDREPFFHAIEQLNIQLEKPTPEVRATVEQTCADDARALRESSTGRTCRLDQS